jgi:hypothetical protein
MHPVEDPHQYQLQVRELTELLRDDDSMADLREILATKGLQASKTVLASLIGGEDNRDHGVIITPDQKCIFFETDADDSLAKWETVDDPATLANAFGDAPMVALSMLRNGEIS